MRSAPIHDEQGRVFRRQIGEARLHAPLNVEDTEVDRDAPLCIRPKATRRWLAAVVVVRPPARWTVVRSHVLIVLAGVYDVVGEDEETRKVEPVCGSATDPCAVAPALVHNNLAAVSVRADHGAVPLGLGGRGRVVREAGLVHAKDAPRLGDLDGLQELLALHEGGVADSQAQLHHHGLEQVVVVERVLRGVRAESRCFRTQRGD